MSSKRKVLILLFSVAILNLALLSLSSASERQGTLEFILSSYNLKDPQFLAVYKKGGTLLGIVLSSYLVDEFNCYLEMKEFYKLGQLTHTKEESKFLLIPISFGLRYILPLYWIYPYLGVGADMYFFYENNPIGTIINHANGYHIQGGTYFQFAKKVPIWLNLKVKYTKANTDEDNQKIELGGLEYGIGFVIVF